jgi:3-oxoacyl-[acyl-carrier protein] reductase
MPSLTGRTAIVTGAAKGIGAAVARSMAEAGAAVVVNYLQDEKAAELVVDDIVTAGGRAVAVQADVTRPDDVSRLFVRGRARFGPVDILVNNAGVYAFAPFEAVSPEEFHRQMDINVLGPMLGMQEFVKQPDLQGGSIINITTAGISTTPPYTSLYSATKSAVTAATRVIAKEVAARGIRVNAIAAGPSDTDGTRAMGFVGSPAEAQTIAQIPLGRLGMPDDYGPVAVFLASDAARWITGDVIFASGGQH